MSLKKKPKQELCSRHNTKTIVSFSKLKCHYSSKCFTSNNRLINHCHLFCQQHRPLVCRTAGCKAEQVHNGWQQHFLFGQWGQEKNLCSQSKPWYPQLQCKKEREGDVSWWSATKSFAKGMLEWENVGGKDANDLPLIFKKKYVLQICSVFLILKKWQVSHHTTSSEIYI